ncbi:FkbM family methyltransferase [Arundinibacter roseus]|uniref:FkbM family methyltransferase n=1 Tax=Arundinibacter roseus TaxID=2070510 RepID=A0A4R4K5L1_9BACT|nr:FkbM family methyltransferase [Arundinibacter roseus]TDB61796.1 FkbM family methyltransferase [Arundinibacter roseus]
MEDSVLKGNIQKNQVLKGYKIFYFDRLEFDILVREIFEDEEYALELSRPDPCIIDCGANIGLATLYYKMHYPDAEIFAFEANPFAFKLLCQNVEENQLTKVKTVQTALFDRETTLPFSVGKVMGSMGGSLVNRLRNQVNLPLKTTRLSSYLQDIPRIDLVKMDVEGSEVQIVKDLKEAGLLHKVERYCIEYHHRTDLTAELGAFLHTFEEAGYAYSMGFLRTYGEMQCIQFNFFRKNNG